MRKKQGVVAFRSFFVSQSEKARKNWRPPAVPHTRVAQQDARRVTDPREGYVGGRGVSRRATSHSSHSSHSKRYHARRAQLRETNPRWRRKRTRRVHIVRVHRLPKPESRRRVPSVLGKSECNAFERRITSRILQEHNTNDTDDNRKQTRSQQADTILLNHFRHHYVPIHKLTD